MSIIQKLEAYDLLPSEAHRSPNFEATPRTPSFSPALIECKQTTESSEEIAADISEEDIASTSEGKHKSTTIYRVIFPESLRLKHPETQKVDQYFPENPSLSDFPAISDDDRKGEAIRPDHHTLRFFSQGTIEGEKHYKYPWIEYTKRIKQTIIYELKERTSFESSLRISPLGWDATCDLYCMDITLTPWRKAQAELIKKIEWNLSPFKWEWRNDTIGQGPTAHPKFFISRFVVPTYSHGNDHTYAGFKKIIPFVEKTFNEWKKRHKLLAMDLTAYGLLVSSSEALDASQEVSEESRWFGQGYIIISAPTNDKSRHNPKEGNNFPPATRVSETQVVECEHRFRRCCTHCMLNATVIHKQEDCYYAICQRHSETPCTILDTQETVPNRKRAHSELLQPSDTPEPEKPKDRLRKDLKRMKLRCI